MLLALHGRRYFAVVSLHEWMDAARPKNKCKQKRFYLRIRFSASWHCGQSYPRSWAVNLCTELCCWPKIFNDAFVTSYFGTTRKWNEKCYRIGQFRAGDDPCAQSSIPILLFGLLGNVSCIGASRWVVAVGSFVRKVALIDIIWALGKWYVGCVGDPLTWRV